MGSFVAELACDALGELTFVEGWVEEALSRPTRAFVRVLAPEVLDAKSALLQKATVSFGDGDTRTFELIVTAVRYLAPRGAEHLHEIELAHASARFALSGGRKIFQDLTTKAIVEAVLAKGHVSVKGGVTGRSHHYCVQYDESDLDFVCRLLEDDGISFLCEDGPALNLLDGLSHAEAVEGIEALPLVDVDVRGLAVTRFVVEHRATTDAVVLADWNFETPQLDLTVDAKVSTAARFGVVEFPGGYAKSSEGVALAKKRAEALAGDGVIAEGTSSCAAFTAGRTFELTETSRLELNDKWLLRSVRHEIRPRARPPQTSYDNHFVCSPAARPYRAPRVTPRPHAHGVEVAVVSAPSGEEIHTDEYGRLKAHFRWDRDGKSDGKDSCFVRLLQPAIGGTVLLGRTGWEVFVRHLDGDPSRPIAIARADHAQHPSAYSLPANKTRTAFRTVSSPGKEKPSEIRFEDASGKMELYLHAAKDWDEHVRNDKHVKIGKDESVDIGIDSFLRVDDTQTIDAKKNRNEKVGGTDLLRVVGDRETAVTGEEKLETTGNTHVKIGGKDAETVGAASTVKAKEEIRRTSKGKWTLMVGAAAMAEAGTTHTFAVAGGLSRTIGGASTTSLQKSMSDQVGKDLTITIGAVAMRSALGKRVVSSEGKATWTVGALVSLTGATKIQLSGKKVKLTVTGAVALSGGGAILNLTPASASLVGMVTTNASGEVVVSGNPNLAG
jgi:type VI secretion system secreted protein VgrG